MPDKLKNYKMKQGCRGKGGNNGFNNFQSNNGFVYPQYNPQQQPMISIAEFFAMTGLGGFNPDKYAAPAMPQSF
jgi:hypothetical protein